MVKSQLKNTDIEISRIGMGCWSYGGGAYWGEQDQKDVNRVVSMALDRGINLFDTAEMYNDGESEASLGEALKGRRSEAVLVTKVSPSNTKPDVLMKHCEASLKRLGTDYIDIYMVHWPITSHAIKNYTNDKELIGSPPSVIEAFDTLNRLRSEGKIRQFGVSNFGVVQMQEVLAANAGIVINELPYNLLSRAIEEDILPFCIKSGIDVIGYMALQQGLLAGIYKTANDVPANQAHSRHFHYEHGGDVSRHGEEGAEEEMFEAIKKINEVAGDLKVQIAQLSIAWAVARQGITCTLVGSRNTRELELNIEAAELKLETGILTLLDSISAPVLHKLGFSPDYYENRNNSRVL